MMRIRSSRLVVAATLAAGMSLSAVSPASASLITYSFESGSPAAVSNSPHITAGGMAATGGWGISNSSDMAYIRVADVGGTDESTAVNANENLSFTITVANGYVLDLSSLSFDYGYNADGVNTGGSYTYFVRSSALNNGGTTLPGGDFTLDVDNPSTAVTWQQSGPISLGSAFQNLTGTTTFSIYVYQNDAAAGTIVRMDNIAVDGAVTPAPEPASLALLALGGLMMLPRRRAKS